MNQYSTRVIALVIFFFLFLGINGCTPKEESPITVLRDYLDCLKTNKEKAYTLTDEISREHFTLEEFLTFDDNPINEYEIKKIDSVPFPVISRRMRFAVLGVKPESDQIDSSIFYFNLRKNDINEWKVVWIEPYINSSDEAYRKGDKNGALSYVSKALEIDSFCSQAWKEKFFVNMIDPNFDNVNSVEQAVKKIANLEPYCSESHEIKARFYYGFKKPDLAKKYFKLNIKNSCNSVDRSDAFANLSLLYAGDSLEQAIKYMRRAISLDTNDTYNVFRYGDYLLTNDEVRKADSILTKASKMEPMANHIQGELFFYLAMAKLGLEDLELAKKNILVALEFEPFNTKYEKLNAIINNLQP